MKLTANKVCVIFSFLSLLISSLAMDRVEDVIGLYRITELRLDELSSDNRTGCYRVELPSLTHNRKKAVKDV
jgi:hypothetical protein